MKPIGFNYDSWCSLLFEIEREFNLNMTEDVRFSWFQTLSGRYEQPWRRFHNCNHISALLQQFETRVQHCCAPLEFQVAIWTHDAEMDLREADEINIQRSIQLVEEFAREVGLPASFDQYVYHLLRATNHAATPNSLDQRLMADIDLTSLGGTWEHFSEMLRLIGEEYASAGYNEAQYTQSRIAFFEDLIESRKHIYYMPVFRQDYENAAQSNIARYLKEVCKPF